MGKVKECNQKSGGRLGQAQEGCSRLRQDGEGCEWLGNAGNGWGRL